MIQLTANVNKLNDHHYLISGYSTEVQLSLEPGKRHIYTESSVNLRFAQQGGDGITDLDLVTILMDRLNNFKGSVNADSYNNGALLALKDTAAGLIVRDKI